MALYLDITARAKRSYLSSLSCESVTCCLVPQEVMAEGQVGFGGKAACRVLEPDEARAIPPQQDNSAKPGALKVVPADVLAQQLRTISKRRCLVVPARPGLLILCIDAALWIRSHLEGPVRACYMESQAWLCTGGWVYDSGLEAREGFCRSLRKYALNLSRPSK